MIIIYYVEKAEKKKLRTNNNLDKFVFEPLCCPVFVPKNVF